jgi:Nucleotidyltransferase
MSADEFADIARLIDALRPWLAHLVIVGGWAHRLHRFHPLANPPAYQPLRTKDADVAFSLKAPLEGDIGAALKAADFEQDFLGEHTPPVTHYRLGGDDQGFYAEFLAPRAGGPVRRDGKPDATVTKAGVTAQKLRHLNLLLMHPWRVGLGASVGVPLAVPTEVQLPNPVSFIAQKLLIQKHRPPDKRAQDALYIHDTLDLFGSHLEELRATWLDELRPEIPPKTAKEIERLHREQFGAVSDMIRTAARIPQDRAIPPERMQLACSFGLEEIFGTE